MGGEPTQQCRSTLAPFQVGAGPPGPYPATNGLLPRDDPPCSSRFSAAHPMGSLLMGKALACSGTTQLLFRCISVVAAAVVTYGTPPFWSTRYRASPLSHICARVMAPASRLQVSAGPRPGFQWPCLASPIHRSGKGVFWVGLEVFCLCTYPRKGCKNRGCWWCSGKIRPHLGKTRPIWAVCTKSGQKCPRIGGKKFNHLRKGPY